MSQVNVVRCRTASHAVHELHLAAHSLRTGTELQQTVLQVETQESLPLQRVQSSLLRVRSFGRAHSEALDRRDPQPAATRYG